MNIKKELNDWHKQMEEDFYPFDPIFIYVLIPFVIILIIFGYRNN